MSNAAEWDYVVIGAGSTGCALTHELVKSGHDRVLLLEAGGTNRDMTIKIPALVGQAWNKFNWGYVSQADASRGGATERWHRGRVLGGSSSINGTIFVRGAAHDFDRWASIGNIEWAYADVLPLFRYMERSDHTHPSRGKDGPLFVNTVRHPHSLTKAFVSSAVAAGFSFNPDYNAETQEGISFVQTSQRNGLRFSAADAFVKPIVGKKNFTLLLRAHVDCLRIEGRKVSGVSFTHQGERKIVSARDVIICAGSINTPKLLMLSGIGDPEELGRHGIHPVIAAPEVGKNLQEHPLIRAIFRTRVRSNNLTGGIIQKAGILAQFLLHGGGPIARPIEAVAFLKTIPELAKADIQLHFVTLGLTGLGESESPLLKCPSVTVYVNANYPRSRGRVRLSGARPTDAPLIEPNLLSRPDDLDTLVAGVGVIRRIMGTAPMSDLLLDETSPGPRFFSNDALREYVRAHTEVASHPIGTCRMGSDDSAVVTPQLRVNGTENLWVADASVMPDLISGNTNAACMMIGIKLGRYLVEHRR